MRPLWRSLLFVPATRPDRFEKAAAAGADMVCVDLEDAVAADDKETARATALDFLGGSLPVGPRWILRINSPRTELGLRDLLALLDSNAAPDGLFIPKASSAEEMRWLDDLLSAAQKDIDLIPVIESAEGLDRVVEIAGAVLRNVAVGFGRGAEGRRQAGSGSMSRSQHTSIRAPSERKFPSHCITSASLQEGSYSRSRCSLSREK